MKLCIDNRERTRNPKIDRIKKFERYINSDKTKFINGIKTDNYKVSDYHTEDKMVGIEYKKDDFTTSTFDGTLDKQLKELKENFVYPYLFVGYDGLSDMLMQNLGINPDALIGKLTSILARHHVTIMFVGDMLVRFTCDTIEKHYDGKTHIKDIEYTPIRKSFLKREPSIIEIRHAMIEQIPRLGAKKTNKILEYFDNSIHDITNASIDEIMKVDTIGEKLAKKVKEVLE